MKSLRKNPFPWFEISWLIYYTVSGVILILSGSLGAFGTVLYLGILFISLRGLILEGKKRKAGRAFLLEVVDDEYILRTSRWRPKRLPKGGEWTYLTTSAKYQDLVLIYTLNPHVSTHFHYCVPLDSNLAPSDLDIAPNSVFHTPGYLMGERFDTNNLKL